MIGEGVEREGESIAEDEADCRPPAATADKPAATTFMPRPAENGQAQLAPPTPCRIGAPAPTQPRAFGTPPAAVLGNGVKRKRDVEDTAAEPRIIEQTAQPSSEALKVLSLSPVRSAPARPSLAAGRSHTGSPAGPHRLPDTSRAPTPLIPSTVPSAPLGPSAHRNIPLSGPSGPTVASTDPSAPKVPQEAQSSAIPPHPPSASASLDPSYTPTPVAPSEGRSLSIGGAQGKTSSKWQSAQKTVPRILNGYSIYVTGNRAGRKHTVSNIVVSTPYNPADIQKSGGQQVSKVQHASHALLEPRAGLALAELKQLVATAASNGTWCVSFDWIEHSWNAGKLLPERDYVYEGGTPPQHLGSAGPRTYMTVAEREALFELVQQQAARPGMTLDIALREAWKGVSPKPRQS